MKNSEEQYFMCDKSKIGRVGFIKLADFSQVSGIITDAEIDDEWWSKLDEIGTKLIIC